MKLRPLDSIAEHVGNTPLVRLQRCLPSLRNIEDLGKARAGSTRRVVEGSRRAVND